MRNRMGFCLQLLEVDPTPRSTMNLKPESQFGSTQHPNNVGNQDIESQSPTSH